jgi:hypothetical protein
MLLAVLINEARQKFQSLSAKQLAITKIILSIHAT